VRVRADAEIERVTKAIKIALARIDVVHPSLERHLTARHRCTVEVHILKEVLAIVVDRDSNPFGSSTDALRVSQPQSRSPETRG
jgi:hypothetical protein